LVCVWAVAEGQEVCQTEDCAIAAATILDAIDTTVDPCTDFYQFACGGWIEKNEIPEGKSKWGRFYELRDKVDQALKEINENDDEPGAASPVVNLRNMYKSCMDLDTIETVGLSPIVPIAGNGTMGWPMVLGEWAGADTFNLEAELGDIRRMAGTDRLLSLWVYLDDLDTETNVVYLDQPDLGLPLSFYMDEESYADYIAAYKTFIFDIATVMVREVGSGVSAEDLKSAIEDVYQLEKSLAMISTPSSERRNSTAMYNPYTLTELKETFGGFDWETYLGHAFADTGVTMADDERFIVVQPSYFVQGADLPTVSNDVVYNYLWARYAMDSASNLNMEMRDIAFKFNSVMNGVTTQPERWQTCTAKSSGGFGFAAAHEYVIRYFDSESKAEADSMVEDLRTAFEELVTEAEWMDADTQTTAISKAENMLQLMGYPDWLIDEQELEKYYEGSYATDPATLFDNSQWQLTWLVGQDLKTLRETPSRDIWLMHPAIVNAWYSPNHNTITFPAGILQPPFFQGGWPRYLNYGAMGMVIGHEITHGFDDQGSQYDGTGNLNNWWSEETLQGFASRAQCFIDQYGNFTVPELVDIVGEADAHLNGVNTQGENIADNGGIHESFRAYLKSLESQGDEPALPGLEQFTSQQMFFISNAQVWCEKATPESLLNQVLGDPHSPGKFRVLGPLSNSEDFQREFNCPVDSPMNPADKCKLW